MSDSDSHIPAEGSEAVWHDEAGEGLARPPKEIVLSIENVAKMFDVSQFTLRFYEFRGLIWRRHVVGRSRVYGWADCERLAFIIKCRMAGLRLKEIVTVLGATEDDIPILKFMAGRKRCIALMDRLRCKRKVLDEALAELSHVDSMLTTRLLGPGDENHRV